MLWLLSPSFVMANITWVMANLALVMANLTLVMANLTYIGDGQAYLGDGQHDHVVVVTVGHQLVSAALDALRRALLQIEEQM